MDANEWKRLFNRLDAAIARHRASPLFKTEADDALYAAHDAVLRAAGPARLRDPAQSEDNDATTR